VLKLDFGERNGFVIVVVVLGSESQKSASQNETQDVFKSCGRPKVFQISSEPRNTMMRGGAA
jgi:hypothetical protein